MQNTHQQRCICVMKYAPPFTRPLSACCGLTENAESDDRKSMAESELCRNLKLFSLHPPSQNRRVSHWCMIYRVRKGHPWYNSSALDCWSTGLSDRSCTRGMIHAKIHLISRGCPRSSIALQVQNRGLKHHSFIYSFIQGSSCDSARWAGNCSALVCCH